MALDRFVCTIVISRNNLISWSNFLHSYSGACHPDDLFSFLINEGAHHLITLEQLHHPYTHIYCTHLSINCIYCGLHIIYAQDWFSVLTVFKCATTPFPIMPPVVISRVFGWNLIVFCYYFMLVMLLQNPATKHQVICVSVCQTEWNGECKSGDDACKATRFEILRIEKFAQVSINLQKSKTN